MARHGVPHLLTVLALSGCAGFWHPRLTNDLLPPGQSLVEAAARVVVAQLPPDSTRTVVLMGPGPTDSAMLMVPHGPVAQPKTLRFTEGHLTPDSLAISLTFVTSCVGACSRGGSTVALHRKPGRNWTVWAVTNSWVTDYVTRPRPRYSLATYPAAGGRGRYLTSAWS